MLYLTECSPRHRPLGEVAHPTGGRWTDSYSERMHGYALWQSALLGCPMSPRLSILCPPTLGPVNHETGRKQTKTGSSTMSETLPRLLVTHAWVGTVAVNIVWLPDVTMPIDTLSTHPRLSQSPDVTQTNEDGQHHHV